MSTPWQIELGQKLHNLRMEQGLKLRELAQSANMYWIELDRYERGEQTPDLHKLYMIAEILNVSLHEILPPHAKEPEEYTHEHDHN